MIEARQRFRAPRSRAVEVFKIAGRRSLSAICIALSVLFLCFASDGALAANAQIDAGASELRAGQYESAIQRLTAALGDENLTSRDAALALYYRGLAQRKLGRNAQAIADLGNGMFLGLPSMDRVTAQVERGFAFRDLSLPEESQREMAYAQKAAPNQASRLIKQGGTNIAEVAKGTQQVPVGGFWDRLSPFGGRAAPVPTPAPAPAQTTTAAQPETSEEWSTTVASRDQNVPVPSPSAAPTATTPTAAAPTQAPESAPQQKSGGNALTRWFGSWGNSYAEPSSQSASTGEGGYRLQLAASRSEAEANQLWQKVAASNPNLAGKTPQIVKADLGDLGTFYRVQIGPFSDKAESEKLCNDLKQSGVECFPVVTR